MPIGLMGTDGIVLGAEHSGVPPGASRDANPMAHSPLQRQPGGFMFQLIQIGKYQSLPPLLPPPDSAVHLRFIITEFVLSGGERLRERKFSGIF